MLLTKQDEYIPRGLSTWGRSCEPGRWEIRSMLLQVEARWMWRSLANWACNSITHFSRQLWEQSHTSTGQGWALVRDISLSRRNAHCLFSHQLEAEHNVSATIVLPCVESFVSSSTQPQKAVLRHSWVHTTHPTSYTDAQHYYVRPLSWAETPVILYAERSSVFCTPNTRSQDLQTFTDIWTTIHFTGITIRNMKELDLVSYLYRDIWVPSKSLENLKGDSFCQYNQGMEFQSTWPYKSVPLISNRAAKGSVCFWPYSWGAKRKVNPSESMDSCWFMPVEEPMPWEGFTNALVTHSSSSGNFSCRHTARCLCVHVWSYQSGGGFVFVFVFFCHWVGMALYRLLVDCMPGVQTWGLLPRSRRGVSIFPCSWLLSLYLLGPHLPDFSLPNASSWCCILDHLHATSLSCSHCPGNVLGTTEHDLEQKLGATIASIRGQQLHCHCHRLKNIM